MSTMYFSSKAIASSVCGVVVVLSCYHDVMWAVHPLASQYGLAASSYFIYDTFAMYEVRHIFLHCRKFMIMHFHFMYQLY